MFESGSGCFLRQNIGHRVRHSAVVLPSHLLSQFICIMTTVEYITLELLLAFLWLGCSSFGQTDGRLAVGGGSQWFCCCCRFRGRSPIQCDLQCSIFAHVLPYYLIFRDDSSAIHYIAYLFIPLKFMPKSALMDQLLSPPRNTNVEDIGTGRGSEALFIVACQTTTLKCDGLLSSQFFWLLRNSFLSIFLQLSRADS